MPPPLLELRHVGKSFAGVRALDDLSLAIAPGEIHCLAGENGSGKSTLIKIVSGVYQADQGELLFDGEPVRGLTPARAIARGVQVIFQDFSLFGNLTVAENLALSNELRDRRRFVRWRRVRAIAAEAVARLGVDLDLDADVERLPTSGRQLVAIARALMSDARLLIMDEPTTALTRKEVETLFRIVRDIQARGISVLFVSHKMREMLEISERITVIRNGRVVASGPTAGFDEISITRAMTGHDPLGAPFVRRSGGTEVPRLAVQALGVPGRFSDIDLAAQPGEIIGISGLLGSGRTDFALTLFGMHPDYRGRIAIDGAEVRLASVQDAVRHGIAYVPEDRLTEGLFPTQSINRNLLASSHARYARHGLLAVGRANAAAGRMIEAMQIATPTGERPVIELSGGNQQRVVMGRWLMTEARILVLNGPTVGVDVGSKAGIHRKLRELAETQGLTVLMISDDVPELVQNCSRILIMHRGHIVDEVAAAGTTEADVSERLRQLA
ncbi:MAG: sugar ABC transporter ATP-binding protein [Rhodospirillales bacterium]|nr:sugar ABC transporter ATP-binding protein [Rhodospirillales bacterium]